MTTPTFNYLINAPMLPLVMEFQVCRIYILHLVATLVTPASNSLLAPLCGVLIAGELLVDGGGVGLLLPNFLGDRLLDTDIMSYVSKLIFFD